jgi:phenylacetate-CoA ligase
VIDPFTGETLSDGMPGELVFTSLTKEALPVIRYRTRDLTCLYPPRSRPMRRIGKITGRSDDMLIVRGVNIFPTQIEELVLKQSNLAPLYQLILSKEGHLDSLDINVEWTREAYCAKLDTPDVGTAIEMQIKSLIGVSTHVHVLKPGSIERTLTGKAKRVIDRR